MLEFVVRLKAMNVSWSKWAGMRSCNVVQTSWTDVDGEKGRQSVFGRPKPLKLVMSTLIWLRVIVILLFS